MDVIESSSSHELEIVLLLSDSGNNVLETDEDWDDNELDVEQPAKTKYTEDHLTEIRTRKQFRKVLNG